MARRGDDAAEWHSAPITLEASVMRVLVGAGALILAFAVLWVGFWVAVAYRMWDGDEDEP